MRPLRVYVASSWRNESQPEVVHFLREDGHEVYDFRHPWDKDHGFSWHDLDPTLPRGPADLNLSAGDIRTMLSSPIADEGFNSDMKALRWCDVCVIVLPCGRSAHMEAGWSVGAGKFTIVLLSRGEPDLMWKMCDRLCVTLQEVRAALVVDRRHIEGRISDLSVR